MCFSPYLGVWGGGGGGGLPRGVGCILLMQFSRLGSSKMEIFETDFFDILTIQSDQISYVKHVLAPFSVFFSPYLGVRGGGGGGLLRGLGHNLFMPFSPLSSSRMVVPLPSSRCLAEGNRIWRKEGTRNETWSVQSTRGREDSAGSPWIWRGKTGG